MGEDKRMKQVLQVVFYQLYLGYQIFLVIRSLIALTETFMAIRTEKGYPVEGAMLLG